MGIGLRVSGDRFYPLVKEESVIGSAEGSDILLDLPGVGPQHCRIRVTKLGIELDDLGAPSKTFVNGYMATKHFLSRNDNLRFGTAVLSFEMDSDESPKKPACRRCGVELASAEGVDGKGACQPCAGRPPRRTPVPTPSRPGSSVDRAVSKSSRIDSSGRDEPSKGAPPVELDLGEGTRRFAATDAFPALSALPAGDETKRIRKPSELSWLEGYVAMGILGEGSQGRVYKLRNRETGQLVAAKRLLTVNPRAVARFEREIEALQRLDHPSIVKLVEVRRIDNTAAIFMEFVDGPSLSNVIRQEGKLAPKRAFTVASQIASGLAYAASQKITHRDVKPSNIILAPTVAKIADFGLVAFEDRETRLTVPGQMIGTPHYMAPEQLSASGQIEPRSDVWGLAATILEAVQGSRPFEVDSPTEYFRKILLEPVNLTNARAIAGDAAAALFERCFQKNPLDRPLMSEVAQAFAALAESA